MRNDISSEPSLLDNFIKSFVSLMMYFIVPISIILIFLGNNVISIIGFNIIIMVPAITIVSFVHVVMMRKHLKNMKYSISIIEDSITIEYIKQIFPFDNNKYVIHKIPKENIAYIKKINYNLIIFLKNILTISLPIYSAKGHLVNPYTSQRKCTLLVLKNPIVHEPLSFNGMTSHHFLFRNFLRLHKKKISKSLVIGTEYEVLMKSLYY